MQINVAAKCYKYAATSQPQRNQQQHKTDKCSHLNWFSTVSGCKQLWFIVHSARAVSCCVVVIASFPDGRSRMDGWCDTVDGWMDGWMIWLWWRMKRAYAEYRCGGGGLYGLGGEHLSKRHTRNARAPNRKPFGRIIIGSDLVCIHHIYNYWPRGRPASLCQKMHQCRWRLSHRVANDRVHRTRVGKWIHIFWFYESAFGNCGRLCILYLSRHQKLVFTQKKIVVRVYVGEWWCCVGVYVKYVSYVTSIKIWRNLD